jgi:two-component system chemotaxis response regulator CheB
MAGKKIRVLIVDDSAVVRQTLLAILQSDPDITVMGVAADPYIAAEQMETEIPDVITLDVEMPRMDGLTFLEKIMSQHPIPVVMCSSLTDAGCATALRAMECGAISIIAKPKVGVKTFLEESRITICDAVKAAASVRPRQLTARPRGPERKLSADVVLAKAANRSMIQTTEKVTVIGASTGGTIAIRVVLTELPADAPGIVIVQHMPELFTASFAAALDRECAITVKEAENNDTVMRGTALIAPGNRHTLLKRSGARYFVEVRDGPLVCRHRPSVDVLFRSAARYAGSNAVGVIMTGMGDDGARGLLEMREAKARTLAQDEDTSVVFGMPNEAIKLGAADKTVPLGAIANEILRACA